MKPVELIYGNKMKPLLAAMWYDRAKKINLQLDHLMRLVDFFEYSATIAERLARQHMAKLGKIVTADS